MSQGFLLPVATGLHRTMTEEEKLQRFVGTLPHTPIIPVSKLDFPEVRKAGFIPSVNPDEALDLALRMRGADANVTAIPDGVSTLVRRN